MTEEKIPFVHLHLHTMNGSFLDGISTSKEYVKRANEYGHPAMAVTEHGRLSSWFDHQKACKDGNVKPIFGVEMYMVDQLVTLDKGKRVRGKTYHLILIAKDEIGYKNIMKLNYLSNLDEDHYYYNPRITFDELFAHSEGIKVGTACIASKWGRLLRDGEFIEAERWFDKFHQHFKENFYAEVQLNELVNPMDGLVEGQKTLNEWIIKMAKSRNVPIVMTGDVHYVDPGMDKIQTIGIAIRNKETMDELSFELEGKSLYYHKVQDYLKFNKEYGYGYKEEDILQWCSNSILVGDDCRCSIPERTRMLIPSQTEDDEKTLVEQAIRGLEQRFGPKPPKAYKLRIKEELDVLLEKGFASYMLLYKDIFDFVEREKLWSGPARGSSGGSLVAYCLGITKVDPIKYGLLFSRFLSRSRSPDMVVDYWS